MHGFPLAWCCLGRRVEVVGGRAMHVAESAKFLGSIVHREGSDRPDVLARITSAKGAFGCLYGGASSHGGT
jgi:hypothetical protein